MDVSRGQADLLALGAPPDEARAAPAVGSDPFGELLDLVLLAERGSIANSPLTFEGPLAPSLLRLLTQERIVSEVENLIFRVRPRYTEQTETLEMPRGRLGEKSLLYSLQTGTPRVESTFDELTTDTPLLRVVASALRVVGSDRLPRKIAKLRPGLQSRAVHLLRYLSGVTLLDRERALMVAERLWLGPLDLVWKSAIDAAIPVLRHRAVQPESGTGDSSDALLIHVSTEKFWEQCLEVALESAFATVAVSRDGKVGDGMSVPAPWTPRTVDGHETPDPAIGSFPDFMLRVAGSVVVADAKYKLPTGRAPSSSDGYQLFTYSHLASLEGTPADLAVLLYPTRTGDQPTQAALQRLRDRGFPLWLVYLPFPTRADLRSQATWGSYVSQLAETIKRCSEEWSARSRDQRSLMPVE